jgi:hypothetical protein
MRNKLERASQLLLKAQEIEKTNWSIPVNLGIIAYRLGNKRKGLSYLKKSLKNLKANKTISFIKTIYDFWLRALIENNDIDFGKYLSKQKMPVGVLHEFIRDTDLLVTSPVPPAIAEKLLKILRSYLN